MAVRIKIDGMGEFRRTSALIRRQAGPLTRDLTSGLDRAGRPVLRDVRRAVRAIDRFPGVAPNDDGGGSSSGLRAHLAASTVARSYPRGLRFVVADPRGQALAKYTDTELEPRWKHRVFNRVTKAGREVWVTQKGKPWFFVTIRAAEGSFRSSVSDSIDRLVRRLRG